VQPLLQWKSNEYYTTFFFIFKLVIYKQLHYEFLVNVLRVGGFARETSTKVSP
jgi:hypothetical protein